MPSWFGIICALSILFAFLIGLLAGWATFGRTKDENYYAGYNDGFDEAYNLRNLDEAISYAKENPAKITSNRSCSFNGKTGVS